MGYICDRTMKSVKIIRKFVKNVLFCEKLKLFFKAICGEQVLKTLKIKFFRNRKTALISVPGRKKSKLFSERNVVS